MGTKTDTQISETTPFKIKPWRENKDAGGFQMMQLEVTDR